MRTHPGSPTALSLDAARALIAIRNPLRPIRLAVAEAEGCIAVEAVVATHDCPMRAVALRAGWAVAAADTFGATPNAPNFAAVAPTAVRPGDIMPDGTDAVLAPAAVRVAGTAEILAAATPGDGMRRVGEDAKAGRTLVPVGERLTAARIAVLRQAGIEHVSVHRPRLALVADARTDTAWLAAQTCGAQCISQSTMPDADDVDLVVIVGSKEDTLTLRPVAMRPGESIACGERDGVPVLAVGTRLEEILAAWLMLVKPCLAAGAGATTAAPSARFPLTRKIVSAPGVADLVLLRRVADGEATAWAPLATGDIPWHAIAAAEAWLVVPSGSEGHAAGEAVTAEFL